MKQLLQDSLIQQFFIQKSFRFWRHLFLFIPLSILTLNFVWYIDIEVSEYYRFYAWVTYILVLGTIIYSNIYLLVPRFLLKDKFTQYTFSLIVLVIFLIVCIIFVQALLLKKTPQNEFNLSSFVINISSACLIVIFIILGTSSIVLIKYWILADIRKSEMEKSILESELKLLKNQVNPHFLFNMLNNANVLLIKDKEQASEVLFKLEDLLRYQINGSHEEKVLLVNEIKFLADYLNLEKIRRDNFLYHIDAIGVRDDIKVLPLLFIIFVENAVKHNPDNENGSYVNIIFKVEVSQLCFMCENSKPNYTIQPTNYSGLGLKNIKRRLNLLYPNAYCLDIKEEETKYTINLNFKL